MSCNIRSELRVTDWQPKFEWVPSTASAADAINRPHEDYPHRVEATESELERLSRLVLPLTIYSRLLLDIHRAVFADTDFAGQWKETDFFLGPDGLKVSKVADWMARLEDDYRGKALDLPTLIQWYIDFETIHPYPDGNGRTGGIIVAAYSHQMEPKRGWLGRSGSRSAR